MSQGFLHDELTRACVVRTDDPLPRVLALGRLSLYGTGASRLHDEILAVAAEWSDPAARGRAKLRPLAPSNDAPTSTRNAPNLARRGETEAEEMKAILEAQRERIRKQEEKVREDERQLKLAFSKDEQRQLAADRRHWTTRLESLEQELVDEPERVRKTYEVKARRVEPVGIVYLWPVSS